MLIFEYEDSQKRYRLQIHRFVADFHETPESFLSNEEKEYLSHISNDKRRNEFLQSRFVLKSLLSDYLKLPPNKIEFQKIGEGKPVLAPPFEKIHFNLAHSGEVFAIALSEQGQVGVDIEMNRPPQHLAQIASKYFSSEETLLIQQTQNQEKQAEIFAKFWSGKEALIKTVGGGVFKNVHDVIIDEMTWKIKRLPVDFGSLLKWDLRFFDMVKDYTCSVAYKAR